MNPPGIRSIELDDHGRFVSIWGVCHARDFSCDGEHNPSTENSNVVLRSPSQEFFFPVEEVVWR